MACTLLYIAFCVHSFMLSYDVNNCGLLDFDSTMKLVVVPFTFELITSSNSDSYPIQDTNTRTLNYS